MFKPEYIRDNFKAFGWNGASELLYNQLRRMGKSPDMAAKMAMQLMEITIS